MTPSPSQISLANIVQTVQYRFEYYPRKSQKINSHIIQNVFHTLRIILKQYKISQEKTGNWPNLAKGGGGTPPLVKYQTISRFFFWRVPLVQQCLNVGNEIW